MLALLLLSGCGSFGLQPIELALPEGRLQATPNHEIDFGEVVVSGGKAEVTVTLKAGGQNDVTVEEIWVEGGGGVFAILGSPPIPKTMHPGQQVGVNLRFDPAGTGTYRGTFFASTSEGTLLERDLLGVGCADRDDNDRCD